MKLQLLTLLALIVFWASAANILPYKPPSTTRRARHLSLLAKEVKSALPAISCDGLSECNDWCQPYINELKTFVDSIDDNKTFSNSHQIGCHRCVDCTGCAREKYGICASVQRVEGGKNVSARVVKDSVDALVEHGCKRCGSVAIQPRGDVADSSITINYTRDSCQTGVCQDGGAAENEVNGVDEAREGEPV